MAQFFFFLTVIWPFRFRGIQSRLRHSPFESFRNHKSIGDDGLSRYIVLMRRMAR